jgi:hypothetical protein
MDGKRGFWWIFKLDQQAAAAPIWSMSNANNRLAYLVQSYVHLGSINALLWLPDFQFNDPLCPNISLFEQRAHM